MLALRGSSPTIASVIRIPYSNGSQHAVKVLGLYQTKEKSSGQKKKDLWKKICIGEWPMKTERTNVRAKRKMSLKKLMSEENR